jgi:hypothetical protein
MDYRDDATRWLEAKTAAMKDDEKNFDTAMRRAPVSEGQVTADQELERLRAKHRPAQPKTPQDRAAEALAFFNGPVNTNDRGDR